jgi:hypothetical protein
MNLLWVKKQRQKMRIRNGDKVYDYHVELDFQDGQRLRKFCEESDMKYSSVIRRSLRKFLDAEEKRKLAEEETVQSVKK